MSEFFSKRPKGPDSGDSEPDFEKLDRWEMSQRPEPECDGRCFGCHNSLCVNSLFPYDELERIGMEMKMEEFKNDKDKWTYC